MHIFDEMERNRIYKLLECYIQQIKAFNHTTLWKCLFSFKLLFSEQFMCGFLFLQDVRIICNKYVIRKRSVGKLFG